MYTKLFDVFRNPKSFLEKEFIIAGWIKTIRDNKNFSFMELNDGSFFKSIQVVFDNNLNNFDEINKLGIGSSVIVSGKLVESPGAKQPFEIYATKIDVEGICPPDYPLQKKRHSVEYLRTIAHLRPRTNTFSAVFRIRSLVSFAIHQFFNERRFVYVHTPIITGSDAEGSGEMFQITTMDLDNTPRKDDKTIDYKEDFFGKMAHLTVSGQLQLESFALSMRDTYTFGPTFRAENSNTPRHAAEFWMMEPEIAFADINDCMDLAEDMIKYVIKYCLDNAPEEMEFFNNFVSEGLLGRLEKVINDEFGKVTYTEAIEILKNSGVEFEFPPYWGCDLQTEHERYLSETHFMKPVFVTNYPKDIKAFYMRLDEDGKTVAAFDLMVPGVGEMIGGSQREERYDKLKARLEEMGMSEEEYWWYLELRKYGTATHSGFGLGIERFIMYITGISNIRDVVPFPRTVNNCEF